MRNLTVRDLMTRDLITLDRDETLDLADEIMKLARIRHLPVTENGRLVGLITHRDLLSAQVSALAGLSRDESLELSSSIKAGAIMTEQIQSVPPEMSALEAAELMLEHKWGCLPVVEGDALVGIVTEADFLGLVVRALQTGAE